MRYLYGDSVPFPPQYDFLAALDVFCTQAARAVRLEAAARALRTAAEQGAIARGHEVDGLEAFHAELLGALAPEPDEVRDRLVVDYVRQLTELGQRIVGEARRGAAEMVERDQRQAAAERDSRGTEVRDALERLLIAVRLPVTESQVTLDLIDGKNELSGVFTHPGGLVASFSLGAADFEEWRQPKHVRDFAEKVTLPVGVKRSLFKRVIAPEVISLDEYVIGGFDLKDDQADLRLRKKVEHVDSLLFTVRRLDDGIAAEVHYPDDVEAEQGLPQVVDQASAIELERLWQLVRKTCNPVLVHKKRLVSLQLAGQDVFAGDLATNVVALVVNMISATTLEISRRSPNIQELSLKVESDAGRREEIYLRKEQLETALATVPAEDRKLFDPLRLLPPSAPVAV